ncbi:MAG: vitamin B12 transport system ATP-binding protein [Paraglaciecola sp.]|jgi:vitamin B12 transport system ATP-binding protein
MLRLSNISLHQRLNDVNVSAQAGQVIHVLGANGAGKSSLLWVLSGLTPFDRGTIEVQQQDIGDFSLPQLASFRCLQEQQQNTAFPITVQESLEFFAPQGPFPKRLEQALEIEPFMARKLDELSGGENRRVQIARALWQIWPAIERGAGLILLDEPIQGLDFRHQHLLFTLLQQLALKGNVIIVNHHDLNLCQQYAHRVWLMKQGKLVLQGSVQEVLQEQALVSVFDCDIRSIIDPQGHKLFQSYLG